MNTKRIIQDTIDEMNELDREFEHLKKENARKKLGIQESLSEKSIRFKEKKNKRSSHFDFIRNK